MAILDWFRELMDSAPVMIWSSNPDKKCDYFNRRWLHFTGRKLEEEIGDGWVAGVHPEDLDRCLSIYTTFFDARRAFSMEYRLLRHDGVYRWVLDNGAPRFDSDNRFVGYTGSCTDITDLKDAVERERQYEVRLRDAQRLESLGLLAGGIAHDFNNLLTSIMGYADLVASAVSKDEVASRYSREMLTGLRRAADLTNQMLAYSGKGRFVIRPVNVNTVIEEMGSLLRVSLPKNVELRLVLRRDLPTIPAEVAQIRQVVMNLILNAAHAVRDGPGNGVVSVTTGVEDVQEHELAASVGHPMLAAGRYVRLDVEDTGPGVPEESRTRIFDPFYTTKSHGRGLGLAAVLGIMRGHHGTIDVGGRVGAGALFRVRFPVTAENATGAAVAGCDPFEPGRSGSAAAEGSVGRDASGAAREPVRTLIGPKRVLVVDDEQHVREVTRAMLEALGYLVSTASGGESALAMVRENEADIGAVILDMTMPTPDGPETLRRLRESLPLLPVLMTSGYNEQAAINALENAGATGFIQKPYTAGMLVQALEELLARANAARVGSAGLAPLAGERGGN
jgi:PAS domain S-box-containing protein